MGYNNLVKYYLLTILALMLFAVPAVSSRFGTQVDEVASLFTRATNQLAAVIISHNPKTIADLQTDYTSSNMLSFASTTPVDEPTVQKVRILLVPGHEPGYGGAEFGSLKERNMTVELAKDLQNFLSGDDHFQIFVTRDNSEWLPPFADYFKNNWQSIIDWEKASVQDMAHQIGSSANTQPIPTVYHNKAPENVALRLYGITKWANENDIDITIHIHFNDDREHPRGVPGDHSGFAIYIPEQQYANSTTSRAVAETIYNRLEKYNPVSNLLGESAGVVEDPDLIAIGAHNTANSASMLIEYAYIYEQQFVDADTRNLAIKDMAYQTYLGLEDFFNPQKSVATGQAYNTVALPYKWIHPITIDNVQNVDVFALQSALISDGDYPPGSKDMSECPRSGKFGPCTREAVDSFQKKYNITGESGMVGEKTLQILNKLF
jgi:N-acetylmuramoyl-L-alanine amidase